MIANGPDGQPDKAPDAIDAALDTAFAKARAVEPAADAQFEARLLADFDSFQRQRRARFSLSPFADVFGLGFLARPVGAAAALSLICFSGFAAGASASSIDPAASEIDSAFDQSFSIDEEIVAWPGE